MRFLDTNIILRYLTKDDPIKAAACFALFQRLQNGTEEATTSEVLLHEALYVLTSSRYYHLTHADAAARLRPIVALRGLKLPQKRLYLRALDLYASSTQLDFGDAMAVARMEAEGITEIYSYDSDFDAISQVTRVEPS
jgi:predicted nucleic acid-binding protein